SRAPRSEIIGRLVYSGTLLAPRERGRRKRVFFFQAEDGIRDGHVTGVQTCALPISRFTRVWFEHVGRALNADADRLANLAMDDRSEERRVGKECRSRGWGEQ